MYQLTLIFTKEKVFISLLTELIVVKQKKEYFQISTIFRIFTLHYQLNEMNVKKNKFI
jgi:hypothetical protein